MIRIARAFVALSLILAAPGLAPYQAAAQTLGAARVAAPVAPIGAASASINALGGAASLLPSASLQTGLVPSLAPSAAPSALRAEGLPVISVVSAAALQTAVAPAAFVAPASPIALSALRVGGATLSAAAKDAPTEAPRAALDGLFEGANFRPDSLAVAARSAASDAPRLDPSAARDAAKGPRWVKTFRAPDASPSTSFSIKRTFSVGFLAAIVPITFTMITVAVAQMLGHELHPNYKGPMGTETMTIVQAVAVWVGAAVMAPISEEAIFRGGLQGRLAKLGAKLHLGSFVAPAVITSLIFVALHETSDPVLFATRFAHAMVLSYVYQKEGILASMAAHGFFNGLLALSIVLSAMGMPWLGLAVVPLALFFSVKAAKLIRKQKPAKASGDLAPMPMTKTMAVAFAVLLMLGYFLLMPNIFWALGAAALIYFAVRAK